MNDSSAESLLSAKNRERTPEDAIIVGRIAGGAGMRVMVCRDADPSSDMMANALISGLLSVGTEVWDAGVVPVPVAAFSSGGFDALASVGSVGTFGGIADIRLRNSDGSAYRDEQERDLFVRYRDRNFRLQPYKGTGSLRILEKIEDEYVRAVVRNHKAPKSPVVLDCGCGCASPCAPHVLAGIGSDVVCLNSHRDPRYRPRTGAADGAAKEEAPSGDTGSVCFSINSDGTELTVSDERGRLLSAEEKLALLLLYLKPACLVMPVNLSALVYDAFRGSIGEGMDTTHKAGGSRSIVRTDGSTEMTIAKIKESGADLAVLGDGSLIFPQYSLCPDAIVASAVFAEIATNNNLHDLVSSFPEYTVLEDVVRYVGSREAVGRRLSEKLADTESRKTYRINGWRVEMPGGWFAVSFDDGKEGYINVKAESKDKTYAVTMMEMAKGIVYRCI